MINAHVLNSVLLHTAGSTTVTPHRHIAGDTPSAALRLWESAEVEISLPHTGLTGYLDFLKVENLQGAPRARGYDPAGRPFVAVLKGGGVVVAHQRYATGSVWVLAFGPEYQGSMSLDIEDL
jgi:hypothetical protein